MRGEAFALPSSHEKFLIRYILGGEIFSNAFHPQAYFYTINFFGVRIAAEANRFAFSKVMGDFFKCR
jgi:hypothetical protein